MTARQQFGVMHPDGQMIPESEHAGYPFTYRRMAQALAAELDDDCDCEKQEHKVMVRTISEWVTT